MSNRGPGHPFTRLYEATPTPALVEVPPLHYLAVDGEGDPQGSERFAAAAATLSMATQAVAVDTSPADGTAFGPCPLEGLWWSTDERLHLESGDPELWQDRTSWRWTLLLRQPEPMDAARLEAVRAQLGTKADTPEAEAAAAGLREQALDEGLCVQLLHEGAIENEPASIRALHRHLDAQGLAPTGRHHEIYLVPASTAPPGELRTILRQPVIRE
ncbi:MULTISPECIES: GyrI-like domain-containing protein [Streptomyces violaceusniger group]|uniref:GyrI-like domain-containing protein n=2 Tax=Streptomyces rhizosphaericus TaxID=114699 RepID=A0ABN1PJM3_9ACTN|nr:MULTISPECIES: GyrI-like domain-containing protein [Streptomyces violaceusniger group]